MAQVLGIGISHYPPFSGRDADMASILRNRLLDPDVPAAAKDPAGWPALMREEWGDDQGVKAAARHRAAMLVGLRKARAALIRETRRTETIVAEAATGVLALDAEADVELTCTTASCKYLEYDVIGRRVEYDANVTADKIYNIPDLDDFLGDRIKQGR